MKSESEDDDGSLLGCVCAFLELVIICIMGSFVG